MQAGKRNHQLVIQRPTVTGTLGNLSASFTTVATVWASRKNLNQKRALENGVETLEGTALFNILYYDYPTIDKTCLVVDGSNTYTVHSAVINEKIDIDLICKIKL